MYVTADFDDDGLPDNSFTASRPRIDTLTVKNYRSTDSDGITINLQADKSGPTVLIGENNSGKSNILRAVLHLFGDRWPGTWKPEDHDHFGRDQHQNAIEITAAVSNVASCYRNHTIHHFHIKSDVPEFYFFGCSDPGCNGGRRPSSQMRDRLYAMDFGPHTELGHQLSYRNQWTMLSKLMREFHIALVSDPARTQRLKDVFDQTVEIFDEVYEFQSFKDELVGIASSLSQGMQYALNVDFSAYDPSNYFKSLQIYPTELGTVRAFEELGSGQKQVLMLALARAYAASFKGDHSLLIVCDEPETHLHPSAQQLLATRLSEMNKEAGLQVLIATHSPYFVDLAHISNIVKVTKNPESGATEALQHTTQTFESEINARGNKRSSHSSSVYYEAMATLDRKSAIFARSVVLVEGESELLALPTLIARAVPQLDPVSFGAFFVLASGEGDLPKWARFYQTLKIPVFIIADSDKWKSHRLPSLTNAWNSVNSEYYPMPSQFSVESPAHIAGNMCFIDGAFESFGKVYWAVDGMRWNKRPSTFLGINLLRRGSAPNT